MEISYLEKGLSALANAGHMAPRKWGEGHWGAAVIAAYFLCIENDLRRSVFELIRAQVDMFMTHKPDLFEVIASEDMLELDVATEIILKAFHPRAGELCAIGHNVIFTSLGIKALTHCKAMRSRKVVEGIAKMISAFSRNPGYFSVNNKPRVIHPTSEHFVGDVIGGNSFEYARSVLEFFSKTDRTYDEELRDMQVGHILTHGEAIVSLSDSGQIDLAKQAYGAFLVRMKLFEEARALAPVMNGKSKKEFVDPRSEAFWSRDLGNKHWWDSGHAFKYVYSMLNLLRHVGEIEFERYGDQFRILEI
jgi:hypothetical protein